MSDSLYRELILEEYKNPKNKGVLPNHTHQAKKHNPLCGDEIEITLIVNQQTITDVKFNGKGCAISQAAASLFTEHIKGKKTTDVATMNEQTILHLLGVELNPMRMKCAVLVIRAIADALKENK